ncbi:Chitosanase [Chryseobacterium aquaeductus]|uniref:Chitosanase n=1 Tax=Chryseobacterium aquaeductus TaxID=2675056 RepID=A0A9N8MD64_9FLAO|nr:chitosanase [Chryseobacterium aquaeductus]CAA7329611.1 Chitosanase [Chryseobacterium potabilaquae]CAD7797922.1 Chitosanase [Chryseobacterium aquaeductus]
MITNQQKTKILQVINVFETGSKDGKYDTLVIYADGKNGSRQITYGRSQTTEQGNLKALIQMYITRNGIFATQLKVFVNKIGQESLVDNTAFKNLLRRSAREDIIMRTCQDDFFDILYYKPAFQFFQSNRFTTALSLLVIYDSFIHSGGIPSFLRERFAEKIPVNGGDEKKWITQYVNTRHLWLANHSRKILQKTIYRTECFKNQIANNNWDLSKEIIANGIKIS